MARRPRHHLELRDDGSLWFHVPLSGGWTASYRLVLRGDRPIVGELRVHPTAGDEIPRDARGERGPGLNGAYLRREVTMPRHIFDLLPAALRNPANTNWDIGQFAGRWWVEERLGINPDSDDPQRTRRGPKPWPDEKYARLAREVVEAHEAGSRSPVEDVAKRWRKKPGALRAALRRARKRGLLTESGPGRFESKLTPRASKLLRENPLAAASKKQSKARKGATR